VAVRELSVPALKDIPAYSEWSKWYGEKFQKEMEAMRAQLQKELNKVQQQEQNKTQPSSPTQQPVLPQVYQQAIPAQQVDKQVTITLQLPGVQEAKLRTDESGLNNLLNILEQAGLNKT